MSDILSQESIDMLTENLQEPVKPKKKIKTVAQALKTVKQDGKMLKYIPEELKTAEVCFEAVKKNCFALEYVPKNLLARAFLETGVQMAVDGMQRETIEGYLNSWIETNCNNSVSYYEKILASIIKTGVLCVQAGEHPKVAEYKMTVLIPRELIPDSLLPEKERYFSKFTAMPKKYFNVTGLCLPDKHYMVDISNKVNQIATMVERGDYFTINRARQYGKTTVIRQLEKYLQEKGYQVARISFEGIGDTPFENEEKFCQNIIDQISRAIDRINPEFAKLWIDDSVKTFRELDIFLSKTCKNEKVVLIIDETDKTSNNLVFLRFVGMLRDKYLERENLSKATFQSVILAGVYDIRNLVPPPWNIAAEFKVDMSFSAPEIATMLNEYENDYKTGMDIEAISKEIRAYTNGYPYLVSRICQKIEEDLDRDWTINGIQKAVKMILRDRNTLFDDIAQNIAANKELHDMMFNIVALGEQYTYSAIDATIDLGLTFGFLIRQGDNVVIGNKIFEILFYEYFIHRMKLKKRELREDLASEVVFNNKFNMQLTIEKFTRHYYELYRESEKKFIESECRMLFLTYLRPLLNGGGFYHIESETRNAKRMDVIVDYNSEQFIVELKLWYGDTSHENALEQLAGYLDSKNKNTGYLLTFDFRKEQNTGKPKMEWVEYKGKKIFDIIVGI